MKDFIICLFFVITGIYHHAFSQDLQGNAAQENLDKIGGMDYGVGIVRKFDNRYEGIKGTPFYLEDWTDGSINFENGDTIDNLKLKYNLYEDELLVLDRRLGAIYVDKSRVSTFYLAPSGGQGYRFSKLPHPKKETLKTYYRIIYQGEITLLENIKVVFEKANYSGGYSNDKKYDEFKKYTSFYFIKKNSENPRPQKLKTNAGAVSKIFPNHQKEIKKYINQNLLDCRKEDALLRVFGYYHKLKES